MKLFGQPRKDAGERPFTCEQIKAFEEVERAFANGERLAEALDSRGVEHRAFMVWRALKEDKDAVMKASQSLS